MCAVQWLVCNQEFISTCNQCNLLFDAYGFQLYVTFAFFLPLFRFLSFWLIASNQSLSITNKHQPPHTRFKWPFRPIGKCKFYTHHPFAMIRWWGIHKEHFYVFLIFLGCCCFFLLLSKLKFCMHRLCVRGHISFALTSNVHIYSFFFMLTFCLRISSRQIWWHNGIDFGAAIWSLLSFLLHFSPSIRRIVVIHNNIKFEFCNGVIVDVSFFLCRVLQSK